MIGPPRGAAAGIRVHRRHCAKTHPQPSFLRLNRCAHPGTPAARTSDRERFREGPTPSRRGDGRCVRTLLPPDSTAREHVGHNVGEEAAAVAVEMVAVTRRR